MLHPSTFRVVPQRLLIPLIALFWVIACTPATVAPPNSPKALVIGSVDGTSIGSTIGDAFNASAHDGVRSDLPIVIAGSGFTSLTASQKISIRQTFFNNHPVIVLNPTSQHIQTLLSEILGSRHKQSLSPGISSAEVYACGKRPNGTFEQYLSYGLPTINDKDGYKQGRVKNLKEWIDNIGVNEGNRGQMKFQTPSQKLLTSLMNKQGGLTLPYYTTLPEKTYDVLYAQGTLPAIPIPPTSENDNLVLTTLNIGYYSVHDNSADVDWFLITENMAYEAANVYQVDLATIRGYYATSYSINNDGSQNLNGLLSMYVDSTAGSPSPVTTTGQASTTSGLSYSFGGDVGFYGTEPTADLSGGVSYDSDTTISLPSVVVAEQGRSTSNYNAQWLYTMPFVQAIDDGCLNSFSPPVATSTSGFITTNSWIWNLTSAGRQQFPNGIDFNATFTNTYTLSYIGLSGLASGACNTFGCNCTITNAPYPVTFTQPYTLELPPITYTQAQPTT